MNYVITGSTGNISLPVIKQLLAAGHQVKVITSNQERVDEIQSLGAVALVGSVDDAEFLVKAFKAADAVYTMVPPMWQPQNWKAEIGAIGKKYAAAINANQGKMGGELKQHWGAPARRCGTRERSLPGRTGFERTGRDQCAACAPGIFLQQPAG